MAADDPAASRGELGSKKYASSAKLASRARALLPLLERLVGDDGSPPQLNDDITIEVPVEPGSRVRPSDADEEILALCAELPQLTGATVKLVSGDTGIRLRARAQGTTVANMPDSIYVFRKTRCRNHVRVPQNESACLRRGQAQSLRVKCSECFLRICYSEQTGRAGLLLAGQKQQPARRSGDCASMGALPRSRCPRSPLSRTAYGDT